MIRATRSLVLFAALVTALPAAAQNWTQAYEAGLAATRTARWDEARAFFKKAIASRGDDVAGPTLLPGPPTEQRRWRDGAPYSPNFLAAYSAYRKGLSLKDGSDEQVEGFRTAAAEFEALIARNQAAAETVYFAAAAYSRLGDTEKRAAVISRGAQANRTWKVDTAPVAPEELAAVGAGNQQLATPGSTAPTLPVAPANPRAGGAAAQGSTPVQVIPSKFALVIGNGDNRLPDSMIPFAVDDARRIRAALVDYAGYEDRNVDVVTNATGAGLREAAEKLAARAPEGSIIFFYFTGAGAVIEGKDYLAGVDAESGVSRTGMIAKTELYQPFVGKGCRLFTFYQVPRLIVKNDYFGHEIPSLGSVSQMQSTLPGDGISYAILDGKPVGIFTQALYSVMEEQRSNRIPILEFGWQVFYKVRRGSSGTTGGAGRQTPTLPLLRFLASDARF